MDATTKTCAGIMDVHEAFKMANQIVRNSIEFYQKSTNLYDNVKVSEIFRQLCCCERKHVDVIEKIVVQHYWNNGVSRPEQVEITEFTLMAELAAFGIHSNPADDLSGHENDIEALDIAVQKEKDMVIFFTGLKGFMDNSVELGDIDEVINDSMQHICYLEHEIQHLIKSKTSNDLEDCQETRRTCPHCGTCVCPSDVYDLHVNTLSSIDVKYEDLEDICI